MKKTICLLLLLAAAAVMIGGEEKSEWTLREVFRKVLRENETVLSAIREIEKAKAVHRGAYSQLIPSADFYASLTRYGKGLAIDLGDQGSFEVIPKTDWNYAVNVRQILFAGGRPIRGLKYASNLETLSEKTVIRLKQQILLETASAYIMILTADENLAIARKGYELSARQLKTSESLFRAGEAARTSVLRAEVAQSAAERNIILAENIGAKARDYFSTLTNIRGDYSLMPVEVQAFEETDLDALISRALLHREEMEMIRLELKNAELNEKIKRGERYPVLTADFNYIRQKSEFPSTSWYNFVLGFSIPIFDGGEISSRIEIARQEKEQVLLHQSELEKNIRNEVTNAFLNLQDIIRALEVLETEVTLAGRDYEDTKHLFAAGEATDLDILYAERTMIDAEREFAILKNDRILANLLLQDSIGTFARDLIQEDPHEEP
jgi:outer membrane protein